MTKYERLYTADEVDGMIARAKAAAAQPEEPVAKHHDLHSHMMIVAHRAVDEASNNGRESISQKEVVRAICKAIQSNKNLLAKLTPLAAAQRTWVGLTDAELADMHATLMVKLRGCYETKDLYKAIETKLKEKNNG